MRGVGVIIELCRFRPRSETLLTLAIVGNYDILL
jgi:hypothetical protein